MKVFRIAALIAGAALLVAASSCSQASATTGGSTTASVTSSSGSMPIDTFQGLTWMTYQDPDGTIVALNTTETTTATLNTKTSTEVLSLDTAKNAHLYMDVYFSDTEANLWGNSNIVSKIDNDEWINNTLNVVTPLTLLQHLYGTGASLANNSFTIGKTYYWGVRVLDSTNNELGKAETSITFKPPVNYSEPVIGYDMKGWYVLASFPKEYDTTIADCYFGTTAASNETAIATDLDGVESAGSTIYKCYLPASITGSATAFKANTAYYVHYVMKDKDYNSSDVRTVGDTEKAFTPMSISVDSQWNFVADDDGVDTYNATTSAGKALTTGSTTIDTRLLFLSWKDLTPVASPTLSMKYTLNISTSPTMATTLASYQNFSSNAGRNYLRLPGLSYDTTYYAQVTGVGSYSDGSSVAVADRTWVGPIVQFTTPSCLVGKLYTFDTDHIIPTTASLYTPSEIIRSIFSSIVDYGNPAPALKLSSGNTISTTMTTDANCYTGGTLKFDFKPTTESSQWYVAFNGSVPTTFDPTSYNVGSPSNNWTTIHGPVIALKYYADDPTTAAANDPVFALYSYTLVADGAVDATPTVAGDPASNDADTNPDVKETLIGTFSVYTSGISDNFKRWHSVTITCDNSASAKTVSVSLNGTTLTSTNYGTFSTTDSNSINIQGMNGMVFTSLATQLLDNVQWTALYNNGTSTYVQNVR